MPGIILNCTKNTELTPPCFARTFVSPSFNKKQPKLDQGDQNDQDAIQLTITVTIYHQHTKNGRAHERSNTMDHLSHTLPRQSPAANHQRYLYRSSWTPALRCAGRLPGRILGRRFPHCLSSNLRGCLC